jgi:hypothetical protein
LTIYVNGLLIRVIGKREPQKEYKPLNLTELRREVLKIPIKVKELSTYLKSNEPKKK